MIDFILMNMVYFVLLFSMFNINIKEMIINFIADSNEDSSINQLICNSKYFRFKHNLLRHNKKYSRYTILQKKLIYKDYWDNKSVKEISHTYNVPASTIYKIVKNCKKNSDHLNNEIKIVLNSKTMELDEYRFVKEYVQPPQIPLTIETINNKLNHNFGVRNRKRDIKKYLKDSLNYSYKKGGATTYSGANERSKYLQSIFSSRVLTEILNDKLIINIDEWVF